MLPVSGPSTGRDRDCLQDGIGPRRSVWSQRRREGTDPVDDRPPAKPAGKELRSKWRPRRAAISRLARGSARLSVAGAITVRRGRDFSRAGVNAWSIQESENAMETLVQTNQGVAD